MATYCILGMPGTGPGAFGPLQDVPSMVHLKGGGVAKPNSAGYVLVNATDAKDLLANGWWLGSSGDEDFLAGMLSSTNVNGLPLWIAGPNDSYDGSNQWLPSEES